jgi:hypothetical protein
MKKIVLSGLIIASITNLSAQGNSCVDILNMNNNEFSNYLIGLKKSLNIKHISKKDIQNEATYINDFHLSSTEINRCLRLREVKKSTNIEDRDRIKTLAQLSKDRGLMGSDKAVYNEEVNKNKTYFNKYSNASLVNNSVCNKPLLYLEKQKVAGDKILIYEKRLDGGKIKTFHKKISSKSIKMLCGNSVTTQNNYLSKLQLPLIHIPSKVLTSKKDDKKFNKEDLLKEFIFVVSKDMMVKEFVSAEESLFTKGYKLISYGKDSDEIFFKYDGKRYRVGKRVWKMSTKHIEEEKK